MSVYSTTTANILREQFALSNKMDSYEKYKAAVAAAAIGTTSIIQNISFGGNLRFTANQYITNHLEYFVNAHDKLPVHRFWWMQREMVRYDLGIYPIRSVVLQDLIQSFYLAGYFIYPSPTDPREVIYTASQEDGLRDKQTKTTFARLFRKLIPLVTDNQLRMLEEHHRSEMDPTFPIATSIADIERVYTTMEGDSGCMRYKSEEFRLPPEIHPSHVYCAPGVGVAYLEIGGKVKSRAVVYQNPADANDKRYVRIYGDGKLKAKLEHAGYRCAALTNAELTRIDWPVKERSDEDEDDTPIVPTGRITVVMPYLDGPAGKQDDKRGSYGYAIGDKIRLIDPDAAAKIYAFTGRWPKQCKSTDVQHTMPLFTEEDLAFKCILSGELVSIDKAANTVKIITTDGRRGEALAEHLLINDYPRIVYTYETTTGNTTSYYATMEWTATNCIASPRNPGRWIDKTDAVTLNWAGLVKLSTDFYPEDTFVYTKAAKNIGVYGANVYVKIEDAYTVVDLPVSEDYNCKITWVHRSMVANLRKSRKYITVPPVNGAKALCHVDLPRLVTTVSGKKVVRGTHNVTQLHDGTFEMTRLVRTINVFGADIQYAAGTALEALVNVPEVLEYAQRYGPKPYVTQFSTTCTTTANSRMYENRDHYIANMELRTKNILNKGVAGERTIFRHDGASLTTMAMNPGLGLPAHRAIADAIDARSMESLVEEFGATVAGRMRLSAHYAKVILADHDHWVAKVNEMADAHAATSTPVPDTQVQTMLETLDEILGTAA